MSLDPARARKLTAGGRRTPPLDLTPAPGQESVAMAVAAQSRPRTTTPRTRPFRLTVDLPPAIHAELSRWVIDAEVRSGQNVDKRAVLLALLDKLFSDPDLAREVEDNVTRDGA